MMDRIYIAVSLIDTILLLVCLILIRSMAKRTKTLEQRSDSMAHQLAERTVYDDLRLKGIVDNSVARALEPMARSMKDSNKLMGEMSDLLSSVANKVGAA